MKQGKTLVELAKDVQRKAMAKEDYIANTRDLEIIPSEAGSGVDNVQLRVNGHGTLPLNNNSHGQIATYTKIPRKYYDIMRTDAPQLLAENVNHWFQEKNGNRMVRTMDGTARAFLSDRYRILDNQEVLESVLPVLHDLGTPINIASMEITESRMYLKCTFPMVKAEVKKGEPIEAGFCLGNSEIGAGALNVWPFLHFLACTNGMISKASGMSKYHIGRAMGQGKDAELFFKDDTLLADDRAFLLKLRDTLRASADEAHFRMLIDKMGTSREKVVVGDPVEAVKVVQKKYSMNDEERVSVLTHLIKGGELNQWGIINAVTRTAEDLESYDRATEFESFGGKILDLSPSEWKEVAHAA